MAEAFEATAVETPARAAGHAEGRVPYFARARALLGSRAGHVLLIAGVSGALDVLRALPLISASPHATAHFVADIAVVASMEAVLIVTMITLAQSTQLRGWRQAMLMLAGAWAGVGAGVAIKAALTVYASFDAVVREHLVVSLASNSLHLAWEYAAIGTAVALFYATRERESALNHAAREAELARAQALRRMTETRLAVLRARIEPEFLFGTLDRIRGLYPQNREAADAMVDALIVYLRAALPRMRGGPSTVRREVELAHAYIAVVRIPRDGALAVSIAVDDACAERPFPPMVLLPLAQAAFGGDDADRRTGIAVTAKDAGDSIRVVVDVSGGKRPRGWSGAGPDVVQRTLQATHGDAGRLEFVSTGTQHHAIVTVLRGTDVADRGGEDDAAPDAGT